MPRRDRNIKVVIEWYPFRNRNAGRDGHTLRAALDRLEHELDGHAGRETVRFSAVDGDNNPVELSAVAVNALLRRANG